MVNIIVDGIEVNHKDDSSLIEIIETEDNSFNDISTK